LHSVTQSAKPVLTDVEVSNVQARFNPFVTLVVDPLGLAPILVALTTGYSEKRKREAAIRGTVLGTGILLTFALAGDALLWAL
jgi:multiple antibiotic resistance protein